MSRRRLRDGMDEEPAPDFAWRWFWVAFLATAGACVVLMMSILEASSDAAVGGAYVVLGIVVSASLAVGLRRGHEARARSLALWVGLFVGLVASPGACLALVLALY